MKSWMKNFGIFLRSHTKRFGMKVVILIVILSSFGMMQTGILKAADYVPVLVFGSKSSTGNGQFDQPYGLAVDSSGNIFVADKDNHRIQKFNSAGVYQSQFGSYGQGNGQFLDPVGVAVDNFGNIFVVDYNNKCIQKFDSSGNYLSQFGFQGSGNGQFNSPQGIAIDNSGNILVADTGNHRIQKFNNAGVYQSQFGSIGSGNGLFAAPNGVAIDSSGNIYVADTANGRIQKFDSAGVYQSQFGSKGTGNGQFNTPSGIAVDSSGNIFVADSNNSRIQKFDSMGNYQSQFGGKGTINGQFQYPFGVAVDSSGNILVADTNNHRIQKFDSSGNYLSQFGSYVSGNGQFNSPFDIAIDSTGNIFVADRLNHRIQKFDSSGNYLSQFGSYGTGNGQFSGPTGITLDSSGNIFVTETGNRRVQKFNSAGVYQSQFGSWGTGNGQFETPWSIEVDNVGNIFVADSNRAQKFNSAGAYLSQFGNGLHGIAIDSSGNILVSNAVNHRIQKFDSSGGYISQFGSYGSDNGQFNNPSGVATDSFGNIFVAEANNCRIQKFNSAGVYQSQFGSWGTGIGQLGFPEGIAIDNSGNIFVAEIYNHRIQKWAYSSNITRIIIINGSLAFGNGDVGSTKKLVFSIRNTGNSPLTVGSIAYPTGFTGNWNSGTIAAGGSQNITVTFSPTAALIYSGTVTVNSDKTIGANTIAISGIGIPLPAKITITSPSVSANIFVDQGTSNHILYRLNLAVADANAALTGLTVQTFGTYQLSDILNFKLRYSADSVLDNGDAVLNTQMSAASGSTVTFTGFSRLIPAGSTGYLFITADIAGFAANYRTVGISAVNSANIAFSASDVVRSVPTPLTAGGVQTIYNTPPSVLSITSSSPDGIYKTGDTINITVNFSEPVILYGTLSVFLNTGASVALTPNTEKSMGGYYFVRKGDSSSKLNTTSILLLTGMIQDYLGADANLALPAQNLANTKNIVVDGIAPNAPIISGIEKTYNSKPVWIISSGGDGNGTFRYKINDSNLDIEAMTTTSSVPFDYQPSTDLTPGTYTLHVQERDDAGNWSDKSSASIVVVSMPAKKILVYPEYLFITESGASEKFMVRLAIQPESDVMIGISSDNTAACKVSLAGITFTPGNWDIGVEVSVTDISTGSLSQYCNIVFTPQSEDENFKEAKPDPLPVYIQKAPDLDKMKSKKAIIVTGGGSSDFLWQLSKSCTDMAAHALRWQGYTDANIMYLSEDNPDPAEKNTLANFEYAVKTWGHEPYAGTDIDELLIYMTGHGDTGTFTLNSSGNGILSAVTLKSWLDTLQTSYPGIRVILIYDACYSGSFIDTLRNTAHQRIIITSAKADQPALFGNNVSFSEPFWKAVMIRGMLRESYDKALIEMMNMKLVQTPVIAGMPVDDLEIGWGRRQGSSQIKIGKICDTVRLNCENAASVWVSNISDASGNDCSDCVQDVYVSVHYQNQNGERMPDIIPESDYRLLSVYPNEPGKYQTRLDCFSDPGQYYVCVYARNMNGKPSETVCTIVEKSCTSVKVRGDLNNDTRVDLADAIIALRVLAGIRPADLRPDYDSAVDVNGDGRVGMEELIYVLQYVAGLR